jgi:hypothetical protein
MFNSICYELVSELADSIPDIAEGIRKKLALPKKNLQPKREEEIPMLCVVSMESSHE